MDEMSVWCEVVRAILPPRYAVSMVWERGALVVASPSEDRVAWVGERELAGLSPSACVRLIEAKLYGPAARTAARAEPLLAI